jgi:hypothetical protein
LFILETRSGVVVILVLIAAWAFLEIKKMTQELKSSKNLFFKKLFIISLVMIVMIFALIKHVERTPQWLNLAEDISISSQIDQYSTWQHAESMGPPQSSSGRYISANTYLRVAWITAGIKLVPENLLGHGVLHEAFQRALDRSQYSGATVKSTHSAFLDFLLSLGLAGGIFIFLTLPLIFINNSLAGGSSIAQGLSFTLMILFVLTESTRQHSVELLIYWISTLTALGTRHDLKILDFQKGL